MRDGSALCEYFFVCVLHVLNNAHFVGVSGADDFWAQRSSGGL